MIKEKIILGLVFVSIVCIILILSNNTNNKVIIESSKSNSIVRSNALAMMLETEAGSGEYVVSSDTTWPQEGYTFNGELSGCENGRVSDKCYVYFDIILPKTIANYIIDEVYTGIDVENGLYLHDGVGSYTNADQEAGDFSYRYAGANPNNYVCFGSDAANCPTDNLYRIIGVFNDTGEYQVKLIKSDYANSNLLGTDGTYYNESYNRSDYPNYKGNLIEIDKYAYSFSAITSWGESELNSINLNTNYLITLSNKWSDLISNYNWYDKSLDSCYVAPLIIFNKEIVNSESELCSGKIGLVYVSEYGYAASPENWNTKLYNYNNDTNTKNNWLYLGILE